MFDVAIVGAGAAGVAAARTLAAAGVSFCVLEARGRIGGRAHTVGIEGRRIDLGAHWMHMAERNPLVKLAREMGFASRRAPDDRPLYDAGRRVAGASRRAMAQGWPRLDRKLDAVLKSGRDRPLSECLPRIGGWTDAFAFGMGLYSGAPVEEISAIDFHRVDGGSNRFLRDGYGALIEKLGQGLSIRLNEKVTAIARKGDGVVLATASGMIEARRVIVTLPAELLKRGAIQFEPALPEEARGAIASITRGAYEHAVLSWPDSPLHENGADQLTLFRSDRVHGATMLACIGGSHLHYVELGGPHVKFWRDGDAKAKADFVREFLHAHFGAESDHAKIVALTDWWNDPLARGAWSICPPGAADARIVLREFDRNGIRFASEATSVAQANVIGGAWKEGVRAANLTMKALMK